MANLMLQTVTVTILYIEYCGHVIQSLLALADGRLSYDHIIFIFDGNFSELLIHYYTMSSQVTPPSYRTSQKSCRFFTQWLDIVSLHIVMTNGETEHRYYILFQVIFLADFGQHDIYMYIILRTTCGFDDNMDEHVFLLNKF